MLGLNWPADNCYDFNFKKKTLQKMFSEITQGEEEV